MADHAFYYNLNQFQATTRRWWPKAIAICAVLGGLYGATVGSAISTTDGAADVIGIAAAVMALLFTFPGARYGFFVAMVNRIRFGQLFVGAIAAIVGAILGRFFLRRILGGFVGVVLGACNLAGEMRLDVAVPLVIVKLREAAKEADLLFEEGQRALVQIGKDTSNDAD